MTSNQLNINPQQIDTYFPDAVDLVTQASAQGLALMKLPFKTKRPIIAGWQRDGWTRNPAEAASFFADGPSNVGMVTGAPSENVFVVDCDGPEGLATLADMEVSGLIPRAGVRSLTGGGGEHVLLRAPRDLRIPNKVGLKPGLDIRGEGGQVVVPPSVHPNGNPYVWETAPWEAAIPEAPAELLDLILGEGGPNPPSKIVATSKKGIPEGTRNDRLFREGARLRGIGLGEAAIYAELAEINRTACSSPLPESELEAIARSAARYEPNEHYQFNDSGNAARFADRHSGTVRYAGDIDVFHVWDGAI